MSHRHKLRRVVILVVSLVLSACGGGGGSSEQEVTAASSAGIYDDGGTGGVAYARLFVDSDGKMMGGVTIRGTLPGDAMPTHRNIDFSGRATFDGSGGWSIPNALIATYTSSSSTTEPGTATTVATVSGTINPAVSAHLSVPESLRLVGSPAVLTIPYALGATPTSAITSRTWLQPASMATLAGRYTYFDGSSPTPYANFTIDSAGTFAGLVMRDCNATGNIHVTHPERNIYSGTLSFAGLGCPSGLGNNVHVLGGLQVYNTCGGPLCYVAWFEARTPSGEVVLIYGLKDR